MDMDLLCEANTIEDAEATFAIPGIMNDGRLSNCRFRSYKVEFEVEPLPATKLHSGISGFAAR